MGRFTLGSLSIPPVVFGAMFFGTHVPLDRSRRTVDHALDTAGPDGLFLDTANNYAAWVPGGTGDESETFLGEWLTERGSAVRDSILLATKLGARPGTEPGTIQGLGAAAVQEQLEGSLRRLQTDRVDVLYAHIDDQDVALTETVHALQDLVQQGKVREIACSNLTAPRLAEALDAAGDGPRYTAIQNRYSYLVPPDGADLGPWQTVLTPDLQELCTKQDVTMIGYSPQLEGAYHRPDKEFPPAYRDIPELDDRLAVLNRVAEQVGLNATQTVLAWMLSRTPAVVPVVGMSSPEYLDDVQRAVATRLSDEALAELDASANR